MALQTIIGPKTKQSGIVYSNRMETNETLEGYFTGYQTNKWGGTLIGFKSEDGVPFAVTTTGNLRYLQSDDSLVLGAYAVITKTGTRPSRKNPSEMVSIFQVQQDTEKTIPVEAVAASTAQAETPEDRLTRVKAALKGKG